MSVFEKWNKNFNAEELAKDVKEVEENGGTGEYKEVPHGKYEVAIEKMELKESKKGDPMFSVWFNILEGSFKGSKIFMNQVITRDFQIHIVNEFLRSLKTNVEIEFKGDYAAYNDMIMDVMDEIEGKLEFGLDYAENKKGYNTFEITDVFEV